jgi:hypothetical protein
MLTYEDFVLEVVHRAEIAGVEIDSTGTLSDLDSIGILLILFVLDELVAHITGKLCAPGIEADGFVPPTTLNDAYRMYCAMIAQAGRD